MNSAANLARLRSLVAAFNHHDVPACAAHLSGSATFYQRQLERGVEDAHE